MSTQTDGPKQNFYQQSYRSELSLGNRLGRVLWAMVKPLVKHSPRPCFAWRKFILQCFGAKIAKGARVYPNVNIYAPWNLEMRSRSGIAEDVECYCVDKIILHEDVTVSQQAFLCTASHNIDNMQRDLVTGPIILEQGSWIFARAFVGPGVTVHRGAVVGACSVVVKDVPPLAVVAGNPARLIRQRRIEVEDS
ncbi:MAG: putative colanic acid biosynthesis acetyltransferase [Puniceicoccales bacterium]